jgi:hypothetical protein
MDRAGIRRAVVVTVMIASLIVGLIGSGSAVLAGDNGCQKLSGHVLMTYHDPDTIIMAVTRGKVYAATVFTMTPTTTYTRNGAPTNLDGILAQDTGYISYQPVYPSGMLLACAVVMTGP